MQKHFIFLGLILFSYTIQGQNALFNKTLDLNPFVREQTLAGTSTLDGGHIIIGAYG